MWQSQDDIVKDLAFLNDFGSPGDKEPYKVLYSIGRGSKFKEKHKSLEKFLDLRTGEVIDVEDEIVDNDYCYKGKGRGSLLGAFSRSKFQLQQQLRLARPLGSGDGAIESYCRRNQPVENSRNSTSALVSEVDAKSGQTAAGNLNSNLNSDKTKHRVKAVRNSSTENNALIKGLLTKCNKNADIKVANEEGDFISNFDEKNMNKTHNFNNIIVKCNYTGSTAETVCNDFSTERSSLNNFSDADEFSKGIFCGKNVCLESTSSSSKTIKSNTGAQDFGNENSNNYKEGKEQGNKEIHAMKNSQIYSENNFYDSTKVEHERNEKYRMLGEKLNRLRKIDPKISESGIYHFSEISRFIAPIDPESDVNSVTKTATNTVPTVRYKDDNQFDDRSNNQFVLKDEEFPPLLNESVRHVN